jgi:hypothetical protein
MPRSQYSSVGSGAVQNASGGGGPNAGFVGSSSFGGGGNGGGGSAPQNPYADVGKFNLNVMSPGAFAQSVHTNIDNSGLIHGLTQGFFGENNGSYMGDVPVIGLGGRVLGNVLDAVAKPAGDLLGSIGKIPLPFGISNIQGALLQSEFDAAPNTPEKQKLLAAQADHSSPLSLVNAQSQYLADIWKESTNQNDPGLFALNPDLYRTLMSGSGGDIGGMTENLFSALSYTAKFTERSIAGAGGLEGSQIENLMKRPPGELGKVQLEAVSKVRDGTWSKERATDFLVANNAGYTDNPGVNMIFSAVLDPLVWGTLGAGVLAKGAGVAAKVADTVRAAEEAVRVAEEGAKLGAFTPEMVVARKAELAKIRENPGLTHFERLLNRTVGPNALRVTTDPVLGRIARVVHSTIDPTRLIFSEKDPAARIVKVRLSIDSTMAVTHSYGLTNVRNVYAQLDRLHPGLSSKVMDAVGEYTAGIERAWASQEIARDLIKRNVPDLLGETMQRIDTFLTDLPNDAAIHIEEFNRRVTPLTTDKAEIAKRMSAAFGDTPESYSALVDGLGHDGLAYLHAATTATARAELLVAIAKQSAAGTWKLVGDIGKVVLIGPGELTMQRASRLIKELNSLTGADKIRAAQFAVEKYDVLRYGDVVASEASVKDVIDHVSALRTEGALTSEMTPVNLKKLDGEVGDWLQRFGGPSSTGDPLYGLGFRPADDKLWRLVTDKQTGKVLSVAPWVDYVAERAPGYRPGYARGLAGYPGVRVPFNDHLQGAADWVMIAKDNLLHQVSTARVSLEGRRRFSQLAMKDLGLTESEADSIHSVIEAQAKALETQVRGISSAQIWEISQDVIPYRLREGPNAITRRTLMDVLLKAYRSETHVVGVTQMFTGQMKYLLDHAPGMQWAGGNVAGQISERLWPSLKFKYNPFFQFQETFEGQFFGVIRGVPAYSRGKVRPEDEMAFRVWGKYDKNLEGVGDQLENSVSVLTGHIEGTLESASGVKRIKYVNAARQFRNTLGGIARERFPKADLARMRAHYGTLDDGEMMVRYMDEQLQAGRDVLRSLDLHGNSFEEIIRSASWQKDAMLGKVAPLFMDTVAQRLGLADEGKLVMAVRSRTNPLSKTDVATKLRELSANEGYIQRVMNALDFRGVESFWKSRARAYGLSDIQTSNFRAMLRGIAEARGMSESEYLSQTFHNRVGRFTSASDLPLTHDLFLRQVHTDIADKGLTVYAHDDPDVLRMLARAREMRDMTDLAPAKKKALQAQTDRVNANPAPHQPGELRAHSHEGRTVYTGNVGWEQARQMLEDHLGGGLGADGEIRDVSRILDTAAWYDELPGAFLSHFNGDIELAAKALLGFLYTQKATSPVQGMRLIMKAADRYNIATEEGLRTFLTEDLRLSRDVTEKVFQGLPIESGLGVKLFDFTDAGLRRTTRFVGDHAPTPSDRWMLRARGHMDVQYLDQFLKAYGYKNAREAGFLDPRPFRLPTGKTKVNAEGESVPVFGMDTAAYDAALRETGLERVATGTPAAARYEETTRWTNQMAAEANAHVNPDGSVGWLGKSDWTGTQMQASIWSAVQHSVDRYPEAAGDMFFHNMSQMALEVNPSARGPFHVLLEDWNKMNDFERGALTDEVAVKLSTVMSQELGVPIVAYHTGTVGSWDGFISPNFTLEIMGTGETIDRAVLSGLALNGQDFGIAVREMPSVFARSDMARGMHHAFDFILTTGIRDSDEVAQRIALLPAMRDTGFMPFAGRDGQVRLRSVWMRDQVEKLQKDGTWEPVWQNTTQAQTKARLAELRKQLDDAGLADVGLELKGVHVVQHGQDWVADPRGATIRERLSNLGASGDHAARAIFGHVGPEGQITQPLLGEFRTLADGHIRDYLGGDATRGRVGLSEPPPMAIEGQAPEDIVPGKWSENIYAKQGYVELVPLSYLRRLPRSNTLGKTDIHELVKEIDARGIDEPLILDYSPIDESVMISEGNHRIAAALRTDLEFLPVRVIRRGRFSHIERSSTRDVRGFSEYQISIGNVDFVHVPGDIAPHEIGLPTEAGYGSPDPYAPWGMTHGDSKFGTYEAAQIMGIPGYARESSTVRYGNTDMGSLAGDQGGHRSQAFDNLRAIYHSRGGDTPLFSGARSDEILRVPKVGETISIPLKSSSGDAEMAASFRWSYTPDPVTGETPPPGFVYHFPSGTKGASYASNEILVSGRFKVESIEKMDMGDYIGEYAQRDSEYSSSSGSRQGVQPDSITVVHLKQTEVFNPDLARWERVQNRDVLVLNSSRSRVVMPPEPGSAPLQPGYVRAYHYTSGPDELRSIRENGLLQSAAKGESYGEPNQVWFSTQMPHNEKNFVEVHLHPSEITGSGSPPSHLLVPGAEEKLAEWADVTNKRGANFAVWGTDIPAGRIVSYGEPWMHTYRTLVRDSPKDAAAFKERFGNFLDDKWKDSPTGIAVKTRLDELRGLEPRGVSSEMGQRIQAAYDSGDAELGRRLQIEAMQGEGSVPGFGIPPSAGSDGKDTLFRADQFTTRGATQITSDGRALMWASDTAADPMTFAHELAHVMHHHLDESMRLRVMEVWRKETGRRAKIWNRDVSEWFADTYIRALREGVTTADPEMQRVFRYFSKWTDAAINKGLLKGQSKGFAARGAITPEEAGRLTKPMKPATRSVFDEIMSGPTKDHAPFNATEEMTWHAMTDAVKTAGYDAFRINFFKRNRTLLERSVNHPMFGLYPASYMWGKVMPELVRFIAKDPFGMPGGHVAWASHDIWRSVQQQTATDPGFADFMDALGHNGLIRAIGLMLPATPWEIPVNAPAWARRMAQTGLEQEAAKNAGRPLPAGNFPKVWQDTMAYQFGGIANALNVPAQILGGGEDLYSTITGEPLKGKNAPSIGSGLTSISHAVQKFGAPIGEGLPSVTDVLGVSGQPALQQELLTQNEMLQNELTDAQSQLESVFTQYPFTQQ